jgi:hypothetical protein
MRTSLSPLCRSRDEGKEFGGRRPNMYWERMSIDEYAMYEKGQGEKLVQVDGVWWREVRPFFYRPLFPFQRFAPGKVKSPLPSFLFGYQYPVVEGGPANSYLNLMVFDDIHNYSLGTLKHKQRNEIKRGLKNFSIKRIVEYDEFVDGGYKAYVSFFQRTNYNWKNDRIYRKAFIKWANHLFHFPKIFIHGAYRGDELSAVNLSYLVEDVIIDAAFFSTTEGLKMGSSEATWHVIRENAADTADARYIYEGPLSGNKGLDDSKILRGCSILCQPAYCSVRAIPLFILKTAFKKAHARLRGMDEQQVATRYPGKKQA